MDNDMTWLKFKGNDSDKYEIKRIRDSMIYAKKLEAHHLLGLDYRVLW